MERPFQSEGPDEDRRAQRFVAGWVDGNAAGRALVLRTFRRTSAPFGWSCDDDGVLVPLDGAPDVPEPAARPRDNPEADPEYEEAFDRGRAEVISRLSNELLVRVAPHGLFVARGGHVVPVAMASDLVLAALPNVRRSRPTDGGYLAHGAQAAVPAPDALTDAALHAFLDHDNADRTDLASANGVASAGPSEETSAPKPVKRRTWVPDRRALLGGAVGALLTGSLLPLLSSRIGSSARQSTSVRAQAGTYVPPAYWDDLPSASRNFFLAWDQLVWNLEQSDSGLQDLHQAVQVVMATPGYEPLKEDMITFFTDTQRVKYHWDLLQGLIPGAAASTTRASILSCITDHVSTFGPQVVEPRVVDGLLAYRALATSQGGNVLALWTRLLTLLGH